MPPPVSGPSGRDPLSNDSTPANPVRRRNLRRQTRAYNLLGRAGEEAGVIVPRAVDATPYRRVRSDTGPSSGCGALRPSTGLLPQMHNRSAPRLPVVDLTDLPPRVLRAGQEALDAFATQMLQHETVAIDLDVDADVDLDDDIDNNDEEEQAVIPSFSRMVTARRAFAARHGITDTNFDAPWAHAPILDASDHALPVHMTSALSDVLADGLASTDEAGTTLQQMLDREATIDEINRGGEMVESEMRRAMAECSYEALLKHRGDDAAQHPKAFDDLCAYLKAAADPQLRTHALRVVNERINVRLPGAQERMYEGISGLCRDVSLRELAALVWTAIQNAPVDDEKREALRVLLLYNLADCLTKAGFCCPNGVFQRLLAPLDGIYPGVQTLARTPYEVVAPVAVAWREAIARGERGDTPTHWQDFETACTQVADTYFRDDTPLYPALMQQLRRAINDCRRALMQEV